MTKNKYTCIFSPNKKIGNYRNVGKDLIFHIDYLHHEFLSYSLFAISEKLRFPLQIWFLQRRIVAQLGKYRNGNLCLVFTEQMTRSVEKNQSYFPNLATFLICRNQIIEAFITK